MYMAPVGIANAGDPAGATRRRSTSPAPTSRATGARRPACSPPPSPRRCGRARRSTRSSTRRSASPTTARGRDRGGRRRRARKHGDWRGVARRPAATPIEPFDTVGPNYRSPLPTPGIRAGRSRSRSCRSRSAWSSSPAATTASRARRRQLRPRLRLDRDDGRRDHRRARRGLGAVPTEWVDDVSAASRIDIARPGGDDGRRGRRHLGARRRARAAPDRQPIARCDESADACASTLGRSLRTWSRTLLAASARRLRRRRRRRSGGPAAGGRASHRRVGAPPEPATARAAALARELLAALDDVAVPGSLLAAEPDDLAAIESLAPGTPTSPPATTSTDRLHGAWLGRAAGCLLGKPVEKFPRPGIRAIAESTGNWPIPGYFTASVSTPPSPPPTRGTGAAGQQPRREHRRDARGRRPQLRADRARPRRAHGDSAHHRRRGCRVARRCPPAGCSPPNGSPTATCSTARNPTSPGASPTRSRTGSAPRSEPTSTAGCPRGTRAGGPARVAGRPPQSPPQRALRGDVRRRRVVGGNRGAEIDDCIDAGLSVIPAGSRYAAAIRRGVELGRRPRPTRPRSTRIHARLRPPPLGPRDQQLRPARVRPRPQRGRLHARRHHRRQRGLGHRLQRAPPPARSAAPSPAPRTAPGLVDPLGTGSRRASPASTASPSTSWPTHGRRPP